MKRVVEAEWLDALAPGDARARRSREDLRRLNRILGHLGHLARALTPVVAAGPNLRLMDLGAGDGEFALCLARKLPRPSADAEFVLVDKHQMVDAHLTRGFAELGWALRFVQADACEWLEDGRSGPCAAIIANLFLHHFPNDYLQRILAAIAAHTACFVACETRRAMLPLAASRMVGLIGAGPVTRHDAVASIRAGFQQQELSHLWPHGREWQIEEHRLGLCSHWFYARRLTCRAT